MDLRTMARVACAALLVAGSVGGLAACGGAATSHSGATGDGATGSHATGAAASNGATTAYPGGPATRAVYRDVAYAQDSPAQRLDLYLPATGKPPYPVLVGIHGGGFISGDKDDGQITAALQGLTRGYAVANLDYRLAPEAPFPAAIVDVEAAIRWLRAHAGEYGLDGSRVALWGDSAGGNLAALAGTSGDSTALRGPHPANADQSDEVQAVVDWFGPISFLRLDEDFRATGFNGPSVEGPDSYPSQYLGAPLREVPGKVRAADPITYLTAGDPPILIEHGTADGTVPWPQSARLAKAYAAATGKDNVTLHLIKGAGHVDPVFYDQQHVNAVLDWLDARLK
jgi:acetyl esterase/lipase